MAAFRVGRERGRVRMAEQGKISFELVSPEQLLLSEEVKMVTVPGASGVFGVKPRHAPLISSMKPGVVAIHREDAEKADQRFFVDSGFAEVTQERCTVLAEHVIDVATMNRSDLETELKNAREDVADAKTDKERAKAEQRVAMTEHKLRALQS